MKVLFAVSNENISTQIVKKYQKEYKEIISYKNMYYFNAIIKELQRDKSYDRIVISEDLEPFANNNSDGIEKFIFEKLDNISDEAEGVNGKDIPIILLATDRRTKSEPLLVKLFGIGIYNILLGQDRTTNNVCDLLNKPRSKKEAKLYYKIEAEEVSYKSESEDNVSESEIKNILNHYRKLGKDEDRYVESFNNIAAQYNDAQLRIITKFLPLNVKAVLEEQSPKYQSVMTFKGGTSTLDLMKKKKEEEGLKVGFLNYNNSNKLSKPVIVPKAVKKVAMKKNATIASQPKENFEEIEKVNNETILDFEDIEDSNEDTTLPSFDNILETQDVVQPVKRGRGRPRKIATEDDKPKVNVVKRGRGRPRKISQEEKNNEADALIEFEEKEESLNETILPGFDPIEEAILPGFDDVEDTISSENDNKEEAILPGFDDIEDNILSENGSREEEMLPGFDDVEDTISAENDNNEESILPGFDDVEDTILSEPDNKEESILPGFDDIEENINSELDDVNESTLPGFEENVEEDILPGFDNIEEATEPEDENVEENKMLQDIEESDTTKNNLYSGISGLLSKDKKVVSFVGTTKNGTSFIINSLAKTISSMGIKTAILDLTTNRNSYYIYTKNDEQLRRTAYESIKKLSEGISGGISVHRYLDVYTALPGDKIQLEDNVDEIISTLIKKYSVVLIDCDFNTPAQYFRIAQEIYIVQTMDILTIQPMTAFLRDLKAKDALDEEKIRVIINKAMNVKGLTTKSIIGGLAFYNDPSMSFMTELFNKDTVKYGTIPFDEEVCAKYLEGIMNCEIKINNYPKKFNAKLKELSNMVYPLIENKYKPMGDYYSNNKFSKDMNDTLEQMKNKY